MRNVVEVRYIDNVDMIVLKRAGIIVKTEPWILKPLYIDNQWTKKVIQTKDTVLIGKKIHSFYDNLEPGMSHFSDKSRQMIEEGKSQGIYYMRYRI